MKFKIFLNSDDLQKLSEGEMVTKKVLRQKNGEEVKVEIAVNDRDYIFGEEEIFCFLSKETLATLSSGKEVTLEEEIILSVQ